MAPGGVRGEDPLEISHTPHLDELARRGSGGIVQTIPNTCEPGSDVAHLSILGYDLRKYYTGRAPLEAAGMGVTIGETDMAFRSNLFSIELDRLADYSSGGISSEESAELVAYLQQNLKVPGSRGLQCELIPGIGFRNLIVFRDWPSMSEERTLTTAPPP